MPEPTEILVEDFSATLDEDMDNCLLTLTGEDGEKFLVTLDREMAEELSNDLASILDLNEREDED